MEKELTAHLKCWLPHGEGAHGPSEVQGILMEKEFMAHLRCVASSWRRSSWPI